MAEMSREFRDFLKVLDGARIVFWTCRHGCRGTVRWNSDSTEATCEVCGAKSTDQIPAAFEPPPCES